jgi:hypothetical protein
VSDGGFIAASEHRGHARWPHWMLKGQADRRPGSACGAPANRIHHHQHFAASRPKKPIEISRSSGLFHAVLSQVRAHIRNELFRVRHSPILSAGARCAQHAPLGVTRSSIPADDRLKRSLPGAIRTSAQRQWQAMAGFLCCIAVAASIHAADPPDSPIVLNPASQGYVNPRLCFGCHAAIFKSYRETGMAKSFAHPRPENTVEDYTNNNHFYHAPSNTYFEMIRRGGDYYQLRYQIGYGGRRTNVEETKIDYFLGSAIHARAYLHRSADGRLLQLPVTWYSEKGGYWWMAPGYDSPDHIYGQRAITYDCIFCHNGYEAIPASHARLGDEPLYSGELPEGVDCQRCHGPAKTTFRPLRSRARSRKTCARRSSILPSCRPIAKQKSACSATLTCSVVAPTSSAIGGTPT